MYIAVLAFVLENYLQPAVVSFFSKQKRGHLFPAATELKTWRRFNGNMVVIKRIILPTIAAVSWLFFNKY
jgi:hypothetical protein